MSDYEIIEKGQPPGQDTLGPRCPDCKAKWGIRYYRDKVLTWQCRLCKCVFRKKGREVKQ